MKTTTTEMKNSIEGCKQNIWTGRRDQSGSPSLGKNNEERLTEPLGPVGYHQGDNLWIMESQRTEEEKRSRKNPWKKKINNWEFPNML